MKLNLDKAINYKNNGQRLESAFSYAVTGTAKKADNVSAKVSADVKGYQVKSNRATVCNGTDLDKALQEDKATAYAYIDRDGNVYFMTPVQYKAFVLAFSRIEKASERSRQREQYSIRLKYESAKMLRYLASL